MWLRDAWWFMTIIVLGEDNIAARDLVNVEDTGKSIPDFITSKSGQIQQLSPDTDQSSDTDNKVNHLYTHVSTTWDSDLAMQKLRKVYFYLIILKNIYLPVTTQQQWVMVSLKSHIPAGVPIVNDCQWLTMVFWKAH